MSHALISNEEIDGRGQALYDEIIGSKVSTAENIGKQIVIDIETGAYEIDVSGLKASQRSLSKHPGAALYGLRIGYNAGYAIGGVLSRTGHP